MDFTGHTDNKNNGLEPVDFTSKGGLNANLNDLGLNHKQIKFVKAYVKNPNDAASAYLSVYQGVKRGAASSAASRLLSKPAIREAVTRQIFFIRQIEKIDKVFVVKTLKELVLRCIEKEDNKYLIESLDMLNKIAGFYNENKNPTVQINTSNVSFGGWNAEEELVKSNQPINVEQNKDFTEFDEIKDDDEQDFTDSDELM